MKEYFKILSKQLQLKEIGIALIQILSVSVIAVALSLLIKAFSSYQEVIHIIVLVILFVLSILFVGIIIRYIIKGIKRTNIEYKENKEKNNDRRKF